MHGIYDGPIPAAIAYVGSTEQVAQLLDLAHRERVAVVARTGGTSTEGGLETVVEDSLVVDGSRMDQILRIDIENMQATVQCGVPLQVLEDTLREQGLTTGHSPQSKPIAQLGGLVATRSIGQFSTLYGAIEDLVVGLEAVLPGGRVVRVKNVPRRAAGPDIRHVLIGSEGSLAYITEVTVKLFRWYPDTTRYFGFLLPDFAEGVALLREIVTAGYRPAVVRLYSPEDARQHFPDHPLDQNLVVLSAEGPAPLVQATVRGIEAAVAEVAHTQVPEEEIRGWFESLNWGPDKIEAETQAMRERPHLGLHDRGRRRLVAHRRALRGGDGQDPYDVRSRRRPHPAGRPLLAQLPDRHEPLRRLRLRRHLRAARGDRPLPPAAERDRRRGGAAGGRLDGAPPRCRQVPHAVDPGGARQCLCPAVPVSSVPSTPTTS